MTMEFCHKVIPTRSQYADVAEHKCHCPILKDIQENAKSSHF